MTAYAVIDGHEVVNVVLWDGDESKWSPPEGTIAYALADGQPCGAGWTWDGATSFSPPQLPFANQVRS